MKISFLSSEKFSQKTILLALAAILATGIFLSLVGIGLLAGYQNMYAGRIYPGVSAFGAPLGGLTELQARQKIASIVDQTLKQGWRFRFGDQDFVVFPLEESVPIVSYDADRAAQEAYALGRSSNVMEDVATQLRLRIAEKSVDVPATFDAQALQDSLRDHLSGRLVDAKAADLLIAIPNPRQAPVVTVVPEKIGRLVDFTPAVRDLSVQVKTLQFHTITLNETQIVPERTANEIQSVLPQLPALLAHAPFKITAYDQTLPITSSTLAGWINAVTSTQGLSLDLDPDRVSASLQTLLKNVLQEPKDGALIMDGTNIKTFVAPQTGVVLDPAATIASIKEGWAHGSSTIPVSVLQITPQLQGPDAEALGIREIIGVGRSNFSGSPSNRRQNIAHGASLVNGTLVGPNEEFSMLKTLGEVDGAHGWLQELVIKGDKTTPEFGGGLCQIGTTAFRTALASGLPITERQNHSYRVRYYEPAGTDATIYSPAPDFRFKNDTDHWILITTHIQGDEVTFTFWGTKDGRQIEQTPSRIFNIVPPPEKKIVETLDLAPGKTKCTETAHAGADATFDYTVTYPNNDIKKVTFKSHYKPWGAVCLLGVAHLSASSTAAGVDETGVNNPN